MSGSQSDQFLIQSKIADSDCQNSNQSLQSTKQQKIDNNQKQKSISNNFDDYFNEGGSDSQTTNNKNLFLQQRMTQEIQNNQKNKDLEKDQIQIDQQIYLRWDNLNFYVPAKKEEITNHQVSYKEKNENSSNIKYCEVTKKFMKQILSDSNGYVKPKELVAIIGPSGSGKTSLLNILANRLSLSKGSYYNGQIQANGIDVQGKFSKFGAFVQQDDILLESFTCKEHLRFAAQMRCGNFLNEQEIENRVDQLIDRLGLKSCLNVYFGGQLIKGLSGGEKKRTSIGYELITNPSMLILDEPTSGLDSHTAYNIIKMLKQEANRGMTVLATIHQPSSEIFYMFDRIILLSEGQTIYNGLTKDVLTFLQNNFKLEIEKFQNPCDLLLKIANDPSKVIEDLTISQIEKITNKNYSQPDIQYEEFVKKNYSQKFLNVSSNRKISRYQQFLLIFKRSTLYGLRSPMGMMALVCMALFNSFILSTIFGGVGNENILLPVLPTDPDYDPNDPFFLAHNTRTSKNWMGSINFVATDQFISMSMGQVLQIPRLQPVYNRERASNMYSSSSYFLAMWLASTIQLIFYPLITSSISFSFLKFQDNSFKNFSRWISILILQALSGSSFGFMQGCIFDNDMQGIMINQFFIVIFNFGSGIFVNGNSPNFIVKILTWISPFRYACEALFRIFLRDKQNVNSIYSQFNYDYGEDFCLYISLVFMIIFFIMSWTAIVIKQKKDFK